MSTAGSPWAPETFEHTFAAGRSAVLHAHLPMAPFRRHAIEDGEADVVRLLEELFRRREREARGEPPPEDDREPDPGTAQRLEDRILRTMWVRPAITDAEEPTGPDEDPDTIPIDWVTAPMIAETLAIAFGGVAAAAAFRGEPDGSGDGAGGEGVGDPPKRARGPAKRKR